MEADYLSWDWLLPEWHLLPQVAFCLWGLPEVDLLASSHSTQCQHYFTLETPLPLGALGLNAFSHPWTFQVSYVFPPLVMVPLVLSKFLAEHVNGELRHLILVAPCWMEAPWLPTVLNMMADVPQQCCIIKDLVLDVSVSQVLKGLQYLHLTLWQLSNVCYTDRGCLPPSVRWWQGRLKHLCQGVYQQCWKEWASWCARQGLPNDVISATHLANICYIYFRWAWPGIRLVYTILLFLLFWSLIRFTRLLIILSSQT